MKCGIYKIENKINGKFYIGSAKNIEKRFYRHMMFLKNGNHQNIKLQRAYDKYGKENFSLKIIEECDTKILLDREQYYLDILKPYKTGYNINDGASGGDAITNHPNREEVIKHIGDASRKRIQEMSDEKRRELYCKFGKDNSNFGNRWNEKQRKNVSDKLKKFFKENGSPLKGIKKSDEHKKKMSENAKKRTGNENPFYGKKHTDKFKEMMRQKRLGTYNGNQNIPFIIDDVEYKSLGEASKKLGIHITTIRYRLNSKYFNNYQYRSYDVKYI